MTVNIIFLWTVKTLVKSEAVYNWGLYVRPLQLAIFVNLCMLELSYRFQTLDDES